MFALTDSTLMELKRIKNGLTDRLNARNTEHDNVSSFLAASDPRGEDELRAELTQLRDTLTRAESALASLRGELEERTAADTALREELQSAIRAARQAEEEVAAAGDLVEARQAVVAQVQLDLSRLDRSATAIDQLSPFEFVVCPRCTQSLAARPVEEGHCRVCLQPDPVEADIDAAAIQATRTALQQQLEDAQHIQQSDEAHLQSAQARVQQLSFAITSLRRQFDAQTRDVVAPRFDAIADTRHPRQYPIRELRVTAADAGSRPPAPPRAQAARRHRPSGSKRNWNELRCRSPHPAAATAADRARIPGCGWQRGALHEAR
ncbi:hypothetical protein [Streptomyces canus]|uniref:hypothetical protein n=1 Tax=Streptomyces canus TaxID=58343 RepID=UPI0003619CFF|nr:hypothetical protein [Streptomyces canus]